MNNEKVASENPFTWAYLNAKYAKLKCSQYTETRKNMNLPYLIRMHSVVYDPVLAHFFACGCIPNLSVGYEYIQ